MIINQTSNPFDAEPLTERELAYLAPYGYHFLPDTRILQTPVRLEVWQPDGEETYIPVKNIDLDALKEFINWYLTHNEE